MSLKNLLKTVKFTVVAVAIWETIASYYKDEDFRKSLQQAKGFDKCKVVFNNLIDVNKKILKLIEKDNKWFQMKIK